MSYYYATLAQIHSAIKTEKTSEDDTLMDYCAYVSERVDLVLDQGVPFFLPYVDSLPILVDSMRVDGRVNTLQVDGYWQSLSAVALGSTALVVDTDVEGYPRLLPYHGLRLMTWERSWYCDPSASSNDPPLRLR